MPFPYVSAHFNNIRSLRERVTFTYRLSLPQLPTIQAYHSYLPFKFTTATYRSSLLQLPTVQVCYSYLPFKFATATYHSSLLQLPTDSVQKMTPHARAAKILKKSKKSNRVFLKQN
ncbi:hypothetical protein LJC08_05215 [Methanimicrococcus sp. OttesenSCG-928-J09]|nr:hypothetical protein [Methanimicrococcus sp. OttesenSCG-928-J09]